MLALVPDDVPVLGDEALVVLHGGDPSVAEALLERARVAGGTPEARPRGVLADRARSSSGIVLVGPRAAPTEVARPQRWADPAEHLHPGALP